MSATSFVVRGLAAVIALLVATWLMVRPQSITAAMNRPALIPAAAVFTGDLKLSGEWILCEDGPAGAYVYDCIVWSEGGAVLAQATFAYVRNGEKTVGPSAADLEITEYRDGRIFVDGGYLEQGG